MWKTFTLCILLISAGKVYSAAAAELPRPAASGGVKAAPVPAAREALPDSKQIERELQGLPWPQFRSVVESIPKLKADVEAYGQLGWAYVQSNYKTHKWRKNIDRLDNEQRKQLIEKIRAAQKSRPASRPQ